MKKERRIRFIEKERGNEIKNKRDINSRKRELKKMQIAVYIGHCRLFLQFSFSSCFRPDYISFSLFYPVLTYFPSVPLLFFSLSCLAICFSFFIVSCLFSSLLFLVQFFFQFLVFRHFLFLLLLSCYPPLAFLVYFPTPLILPRSFPLALSLLRLYPPLPLLSLPLHPPPRPHSLLPIFQAS